MSEREILNVKILFFFFLREREKLRVGWGVGALEGTEREF